MKKEKRNKIILGVILSIMIFPTFVLALEKEETVYANLTYTGKEKEKTVVNKLKYEGEETITDETELKKILNIKGKEDYQLDDNTLIWKTKKKDIYYQGNTDKKLPISVNIKYYLNGKKIQAKKIKGKSGEVKVVITFKNNSESWYQGRTVYTPFVLTVGTMMDKTKNTDIKISNGKVIDSGTKSMLIGLASPGLADSMELKELKNLDSITIKYHTKEFSQENIYIVSTPKLFDQDDLKIFEKMDSSLSKVNDLQKGTNELEMGSIKLKEGINQLQSALAININELKNSDSSLVGEKAKNSIEAELNNSLSLLVKNSIYQVVKKKLMMTKQAMIDSSCSTIVDPTQNEACKQQANNTITKDQVLSFYHQPTYNEIKEAITQVLAYLGLSISEEDKNLASLIAFQTSGILVNTDYTKKILEGQSLEQTDIYFSSVFNEVISSYGKIASITSIKVAQEASNKTLNALTTLYNGVASINQGGEKINSGIHTLNQEGIKPLTTLLSSYEKYTDLLNELKRLSKDYKGFGSNNSKNTKFIYKIKSIK